MSPTLDIAVLGQLEITPIPGSNKSVNQSILSTKEQALFTYLLITGKQHTRDQLAGLLWGNDPDEKAKNSLRVALSHIRQLDKRCVATEGRHRVAFSHEVEIDLDLTEFKRIIQTDGSDDITQVQERVKSAIALYRGDLLDGLHIDKAPEFHEWLDVVRTQLRESFLEFLREQAAILLAAGDYKLAQGALDLCLQLDSADEVAHRQMMMTLSHLGNFNEALAQFELCRKRLEKELNVEPMPETVQLRKRIVALRDGRRHNLPAETTPFVGRPNETDELIEKLSHPGQRLVTILGLGGMGKTSFALHVARRLCHEPTLAFTDGIFFVSLVSVQSIEVLYAAIVEALDISSVDKKGSQSQITEYLQSKEILLILDDWESFINSVKRLNNGQESDATRLVRQLIERCPSLTILVTSREPLRMLAENRFEIEGLDVPPAGEKNIKEFSAIRLFLQIAQRVSTDFRITEANREHIIQICQTLDGMPLGIELAAALLRVMTPMHIADEIQDLDYLEGDMQDLPERHRSLRVVFEHSWQMMNEKERDLFKSLAVFEGPFSQDAALAVVSASPKTLLALIDRSLLQRVSALSNVADYRKNNIEAASAESKRRQQSTAEPLAYFSLHSAVRQFAKEKLAEDKEIQHTTRDKHCDYFAKFMRLQRTKLYSSEHKSAMTLMAQQRQNVFGAWSWALENMQFDLLDKILDASVELFLIAGFFEEAEITMRRSAEYLHSKLEDATLADQQIQVLLGKCLASQARFLLEMSRFESVAFVAKQLQTLAEDSKDIEHQAIALMFLGAADYHHGNLPQSQEALQQALTLAEETSSKSIIAEGKHRLGMVYLRTAAYQQATEYWLDSLEIRRSLDDQRNEFTTLNNLGVVAVQQGDYGKAHQYYLDAYHICEAVEDQSRISIIRNNLGRIHAERRDFTKSMQNIEEALALERSLNDKMGESNAMLSLGRNYMFLGQYNRAEDLHQQALEIKRLVNDKYGEAESLTYLSLIMCLKGATLTALERIAQAETILEQHDFRFLYAQTLTARSHILIHQDYLPEAKQAAEQALEAWTSLGNNNLRNEPLADLARIEMALGNPKKALDHTEEVLSHLEMSNLDGVNFPLHIHLICYEILDSLDDPRSNELLMDALHQLTEWADAIDDDELRQSYLSINHHQKILELSNN